ncbi:MULTISPECIES: PDR/VanB family oxidoreductase [Arthrobacter]|uniref:Vanillate O-demethylase ferredoxin subunit n=1 Tax=Arthrobacter bambusae TaxID=1338426 RepID=A0AAW8DJJ2_9MICC|nr:MULTISPECIES: PDR/VanB family oxidoreductase [Arthrobacter]MDP9905956.1 vanillate O-demethylase ferredoxin subunit [Arthrobacter bambusae]MDQ0130187.1 vanillate O-demethylase ferredoxin subunit [Arthrobacter bambusae]MDQ0181567.1 vanillate O-demethylase ferredoxin subunit [Arthrobacter bambusae]GAP58502.1 phenoxybenzoate dioxygenase subunit beta [Arthrobacter sp. Hiyo1]
MAATNIEVWQLGTVVEVRNVATDIQRIVIEPSRPKKAEPGSHIDVMVNIDGHEDKRSYSIVESSEDGTRLAISVLKAPLSRGGSLFIHTLEPGDQLEITQPLQNFPLRVGAGRYILLAGGIGITAMINMARVLRNLNADYTLVYAGRSRAVMAYLTELQELHGQNLVVHIDGEGSPLDVNALVASATEDTELYMCGPIRLMDEVRRTWTERGLSYPNLRYETFGNSGWHDPEEFIVKIPSLGLEVPVGKSRSMLEALEDAGADMMFDCRKGECGLCEVRILGLQGAIDHRDVFYSARQKNATEKMACCVSRAVTSPTGLAAEASAAGPAVVTIEVS